MICEGCPCAFTETSEQAQNFGCLPTIQDLFRIQKRGKNWACHEDDTRVCSGFAVFCKEEGYPYDKTLPLASYSIWYHEGEDALFEDKI